MVKSNGRAVRFVPERILSSDICNAAVDNDPSAHELTNALARQLLCKPLNQAITRICDTY
jgi:hypothetical protein